MNESPPLLRVVMGWTRTEVELYRRGSRYSADEAAAAAGARSGLASSSAGGPGEATVTQEPGEPLEFQQDPELKEMLTRANILDQAFYEAAGLHFDCQLAEAIATPEGKIPILAGVLPTVTY